MPSDKPVASSLPGEIPESTKQPKEPTPKEQIAILQAEVLKLKEAQDSQGKMIAAWFEKMEKLSQAQAPPQTTTAPPSVSMGGDLMGLARQFLPQLLGEGQTTDLEQTMLQEMQRGYILWLRQGIKAMNRTAGLPEHMTVG